MRNFLDAILAYIGAESLTDIEYESVDWPVDETLSQDVYDGLKGILEARDNVSNQVKQLLAYFVANGSDVTDTLPTPKSSIYVGSDLSGDVTNAAAIQAIAVPETPQSNIYIGGSVDAPVDFIPQSDDDTAGDVGDITVSAPLTGGGNVGEEDIGIGITQADTDTDGYLSSEDWNTFNNKLDAADYVTQGEFDTLQDEVDAVEADVSDIQDVIDTLQPAGNYITALTGDVTAAGPGSSAATITGKGTLTEATSSVLTLTGFANATFGSPTIQVKEASASLSGYLSSTDWSTFNNKIGGSVGSTDNRLVKSSGTGGKTLQATGIAVDASDNMTVPGSVVVDQNLTVTGVTATIPAPTGGAGANAATGSWYLAQDNEHSVRVYSYKTVNGVKTYSATYLQLPTVIISPGDDDTFGKFNWSWTAASGVDGYRLLRYLDGVPNYDKYRDTTSTSIVDLSLAEWVTGSTVLPAAYYTNTIALNGIIGPIISSIDFTGTQTFRGGGIDIVVGTFKFDGASFLSGTGGNTFVGSTAGAAITGGTLNTVIGNAAGDAITTGNNNTLIGDSAGGVLTTQQHNVCIGSSTGGSTNSSFNTIIGSSALGNGSGSNIIIGYSGGMSGGISNSVCIGNSTTCALSNIFAIGSTVSPQDEFYGGRGHIGTIHTFRIQASGASGSNAGGSILALCGGQSTGNATPATILFQTGDIGASGTTLQTRTTKMTLNHDSFGMVIPLKLNTAGNGIFIKEGSNATMGVATLSAGTVVVSTTKVTASSRVLLTIQSLGTVAAPKAIGVTARTAATSFTITSADATDTSVIAWQIVEPA